MDRKWCTVMETVSDKDLSMPAWHLLSSLLLVSQCVFSFVPQVLNLPRYPLLATWSITS